MKLDESVIFFLKKKGSILAVAGNAVINLLQKMSHLVPAFFSQTDEKLTTEAQRFTVAAVHTFFFKKGVLENFPMFILTGKHLCWSFF